VSQNKNTVYKIQKIDRQTKEKTYENIKPLENMQNTYTHWKFIKRV